MRLASPAAARRASRRNSGDAGIDSRTSASFATPVPLPSSLRRNLIERTGWWYEPEVGNNARHHERATRANQCDSIPRAGGSRRRRRTMNVVVCVKQIPDPAQPGELDPQTKTLKREGKLILDDSDAYGVEMGLQLADKAGGGEVTLVSMAPNNEVSGLRTALAMGAAKAILVSDPALQGSDSLATAKVLAAAIKRAEPDLVPTATESTDGYTGVL